MKILVVEDEFDLNRSIVKLLKKQHYSVDSASNGEEALQFVSVAEYDVIILDVMMPKMDGFTFLKLLRNKGSQVSILMLTARDAVEDRIAGLDFGADDYLVKPESSWPEFELCYDVQIDKYLLMIFKFKI